MNAFNNMLWAMVCILFGKDRQICGEAIRLKTLAAQQAAYRDGMSDMNRLLIDFAARVATGKSVDPRTDAIKTLDAVNMLSSDALFEMDRHMITD